MSAPRSSDSRGAVLIVAGLLVLAALGAVGFITIYVLGANTQATAIDLGFTFSMLAAALVVWERRLMKHEEAFEDNPPRNSSDVKEELAELTFDRGLREISGRRTWLVWLLGGVTSLVGVAVLTPLRSLMPTHPPSPSRTSWRRGLRLVREDGTAVRVSDLEIDSVVTVFPEGYVGTTESATDTMANDATLLIRVPPNDLELGDRASWAPQGYVAYSKVCVHAGCPVALYRAAAKQLFCPCHQSTFDVLHGAKNVFGPADRPLPQLPLRIADDGTLVADGGYVDPVGPSTWETSL